MAAPIFAAGMAAFVGDWLGLLRTGATADAEFHVPLGKSEPPHMARGSLITLLHRGVVRCRLPLVKVGWSVTGASLVLSGAAIAAATPTTVPHALLLTRWSSMTERPAPLNIWFQGARECWWMLADEVPFPTWMSEGLPAEEAAEARAAVAAFTHVRPAAPAPADPPPPPMVAQRPAPSAATPPPAAGAAAKPSTAKAVPATPVKPPTPQGSLF